MAIDSITNTISVENPDCSRLRLRTDNGTQYTSNDFRKAVSVFGIKHEFVWKHTPEQSGHVESFHKTPVNPPVRTNRQFGQKNRTVTDQ